MRIARIQWPDDMTPEERAASVRVEALVRDVVGPLHPMSSTQTVFEAIDARLEVREGAGVLGGILRIVTDEDHAYDNGQVFRAVRVRFMWTRWELERRASDRRAREARERLGVERAERRNRGGSIRLSVATVPAAVPPGVTATRYAGSIEVTRAELEAARDDQSLMQELLTEPERLGRMGIELNADQIREEFARSFKADPGGGYYEELARSRKASAERRALLLMFEIAFVALRAKQRGFELAGVFYAVLEGCLRPWARNPTPIEFDIDHAPFGVDLAPAEDSTAARYALLEIGDRK